MTLSHTLEQQHELARSLFPEAYARAQNLTGKPRSRALANVRRRAVHETLMAPLRAAGRSCSSCAAYRRVPVSDKRCCDDDSDFHGYLIVAATDLCPNWRPRP